MDQPQSAKPASAGPRFRPTFRSNRKKSVTPADAGSSTSGALPPQTRLTFTVEIYKEQAPALRSAIEEISDTVAKRAEGAFDYDVEDALVRAMAALGSLRAAFFSLVEAGDPNYRRRRS